MPRQLRRQLSFHDAPSRPFPPLRRLTIGVSNVPGAVACLHKDVIAYVSGHCVATCRCLCVCVHEMCEEACMGPLRDGCRSMLYMSWWGWRLDSCISSGFVLAG